MSYCEPGNSLLETYATNDIFAETDASMIQFAQSSNKSITDYAEALWKKTLGFDRANDEIVANGNLIEGLLK